MCNLTTEDRRALIELLRKFEHYLDVEIPALEFGINDDDVELDMEIMELCMRVPAPEEDKVSPNERAN